jgi:hypothetical protein
MISKKKRRGKPQEKEEGKSPAFSGVHNQDRIKMT